MSSVSPNNINNRPSLLEPYSKGERPSAIKMNQTIKALNSLFQGASGVNNDSKLKSAPQLYIATEDSGPWYDSGDIANAVVSVRPIRMSLYLQTADNDEVEGVEIDLPKFWYQQVFEGDIGIAVNMGNGTIGFYAVSSLNQVEVSGGFTTVGGESKLSCTTLAGNSVTVEPATGVNETSWDGLTIDGVTYTKVSATQRTASPTVGDDWTEDLFPLYGSDEIICVVPNDQNIVDTANNIPLRETGSNKIWVKECT